MQNSTLGNANCPFNSLKHVEATNYLPRKIASAKEYGELGFSFLSTDFSIDTIDVIAQQNRIVLLGDAGVGKTTELERIREYFSKDGSPFVPFFVSLNRYVDENIPQLLELDMDLSSRESSSHCSWTD